MSTYTRQPKGLRTGGRFAAAVRPEPTATLDKPSFSPEGAYRRLTTQPGSDRVRSRRVAREVLEHVRASGQLGRMVGTSGTREAHAVVDAARDDALLDQAVDALAEDERRSPGRTDPRTVGFVLARTMIRQHRARTGTAA